MYLQAFEFFTVSFTFVHIIMVIAERQKKLVGKVNKPLTVLLVLRMSDCEFSSLLVHGAGQQNYNFAGYSFFLEMVWSDLRDLADMEAMSATKFHFYDRGKTNSVLYSKRDRLISAQVH